MLQPILGGVVAFTFPFIFFLKGKENIQYIKGLAATVFLSKLLPHEYTEKTEINY